MSTKGHDVDSATCLIALGSNLGNREATLAAALREIAALSKTSIVRVSRWYSYPPFGGPREQPDFLNAAALVETGLLPKQVLEELFSIERGLGRVRSGRWEARSVDLDLLLYDQQVIDSPGLIVPHPRMSFRRFVLEPAAEIAGDLIHPSIGWSIDELIRHLDAPGNLTAVISTSGAMRDHLVEYLVHRFGAAQVDAPPQTDRQFEDLWPQSLSSWLAIPEAPDDWQVPTTVSSEGGPKLTILADDGGPATWSEASDWSNLVQQSGRGPTLHLRSTDQATNCQEAAAAVETVWPHLGLLQKDRVE
jgi:2-amino-4-hydroxy-6-hydroxymethyldihydropteridine diphosphokinase